MSRPEVNAIERDNFARRRARRQLYGIAAVLCVVAVAITAFKLWVVGVPLNPTEENLAWRLEAEVEIEAAGGPVEVSLAIPDRVPEYRTLSEESVARGFGYRIDESTPHRRAVWSIRDASGKHTLFYRTTVFDVRGNPSPRRALEPPSATPAVFEDAKRAAAEELLDRARPRSSGAVSLAVELATRLSRTESDGAPRLLLEDARTVVDRAELLIDLLSLEGVPARLARGIVLDDGARRQPLKELLEVYENESWTVVDPLTARVGIPPRLVLWQRGGQSLLDVTGARASRIRFSAIETMAPSKALAMARSDELVALPFLFSLYDLPVEEQNVFRTLTLIPLGALILCIARNLIGLPTSGTFMPLLIALAFQETDLLPGLVLFTTIITVGLLLRTYLANLNLLLVPRISAVVVVVILLMGVGVLFSARYDIAHGFTITFFPFVVIAWTIERMSTVWEQEGPTDAIQQCAASLLIASIAYGVWQIRALQHLLFTFTEVNLILLAVILLIGGYNGYRLSELLRFRPIADAPPEKNQPSLATAP